MTRLATWGWVVLVSCSLASSGTWAQDAFGPWLGTYQSASVSDAQTTIESAIERGTNSMGPLRRMVARKRLKAVNQPHKIVRIVEDGAHLAVDFDGRVFRAPVNGKPEKGIDPEGKDVTVSYRADGRALHARYVGADGEKRIDFERSADGRALTMRVTVLSSQLPGPIRYSLRYERKS
jgi:hypothetical protein